MNLYPHHLKSTELSFYFSPSLYIWFKKNGHQKYLCSHQVPTMRCPQTPTSFLGWTLLSSVHQKPVLKGRHWESLVEKCNNAKASKMHYPELYVCHLKNSLWWIDYETKLQSCTQLIEMREMRERTWYSWKYTNPVQIEKKVQAIWNMGTIWMASNSANPSFNLVICGNRR